MIEVSELKKFYGEVHALNGVSFSVQPGEIVGYLGPNGAGKTTTVKILTGLQPATAGTASIGGFDVGMNPLEAKELIGLVPESGALYEALTPLEYLRFVGTLYGLEPDPLEARIVEILEYLELEKKVWEQRMNGFSKGMKQRVVIAASVLHKPKVLIFDEPLNGLDVNATVKVKQLIADMAKEGSTVLYCSHLLDVVEKVCSRIIVLANGEIQVDGSLEEIRTKHPGKSLESIFQELTGAKAEFSAPA